MVHSWTSYPATLSSVDGFMLSLPLCPAQLEATLFAKGSQDCLYGQSLFQRLQRGGLPFTLLNIQYRMHPEISRFASEQ